MKTYMKLIAAVALTPFAVAADPLPKQVENMECLVGAWKGTAAMTMGKDKAKLDVTIDCKRTSAKFGVLCTLHGTGMPGMAAYDETDLFGYEPNTDTYHWYSVTNAGETHDHVAKPTTGSRIDFVFNGTQEGKPYQETVSLDFGKDDKTMTAKGGVTIGGTAVESFEFKMRK